MAIGYIQQVAQAAAPAVPPLIANAVLQDHVVRAKGAQDSVHVARRALGIDLVNLESKETELQHTPHHHSLLLCLLCHDSSILSQTKNTWIKYYRNNLEVLYSVAMWKCVLRWGCCWLHNTGWCCQALRMHQVQKRVGENSLPSSVCSFSGWFLYQMLCAALETEGSYQGMLHVGLTAQVGTRIY